MLRGFRWGDMTDTYHLEDSGIDGRIILKLIFIKVGRGGMDWMIWLRTGTGGGHLYMR